MDWLAQLHSVQDSLNDLSASLNTKSRAFYGTGNMLMGEYLENIAGEIEDQAELISRAINSNLREHEAAQMEDIGQMLHLLLVNGGKN